MESSRNLVMDLELPLITQMCVLMQACLSQSEGGGKGFIRVQKGVSLLNMHLNKPHIVFELKFLYSSHTGFYSFLLFLFSHLAFVGRLPEGKLYI